MITANAHDLIAFSLEALVIMCCLWAACASIATVYQLKEVKTPFGNAYRITSCIWAALWIYGAFLRGLWAYQGGWEINGNIWQIRWLGWWMLGSVTAAVREDIQHHLSSNSIFFRDSIESQTLTGWLLSRIMISAATALLGIAFMVYLSFNP